MASLAKKKKANTIYYYAVESARVDGKPRIVHQTYLGTAESVARLVQDRTAPAPQADSVSALLHAGELPCGTRCSAFPRLKDSES
jgi:hypothetical protein